MTQDMTTDHPYRQGKVYVQDQLAGVIRETENGYEFSYDSDYLQRPGAVSVSLTLPLQPETYTSKTLFSFFDGIIPEGWLLQVVSSNWKIDPHDRFGLLLAACRDCIGDVRIDPEEQ